MTLGLTSFEAHCRASNRQFKLKLLARSLQWKKELQVGDTSQINGREVQQGNSCWPKGFHAIFDRQAYDGITRLNDDHAQCDGL